MKLRKTATLLVCCLWAANGIWAQRVSVSFPALAEKEIWLTSKTLCSYRGAIALL